MKSFHVSVYQNSLWFLCLWIFGGLLWVIFILEECSGFCYEFYRQHPSHDTIISNLKNINIRYHREKYCKYCQINIFNVSFFGKV